MKTENKPENNIDEATMAARRERYQFLIQLAACALVHADKRLMERVRQERQKAEAENKWHPRMVPLPGCPLVRADAPGAAGGPWRAGGLAGCIDGAGMGANAPEGPCGACNGAGPRLC